MSKLHFPSIAGVFCFLALVYFINCLIDSRIFVAFFRILIFESFEKSQLYDHPSHRRISGEILVYIESADNHMVQYHVTRIRQVAVILLLPALAVMVA